MIQNATMLAAAQVIASADELLSETGRFSRDLYWDPKFDWNAYALVPAKAVDKLHESLDDFHNLNELMDEDGAAQRMKVFR